MTQTVAVEGMKYQKCRLVGVKFALLKHGDVIIQDDLQYREDSIVRVFCCKWEAAGIYPCGLVWLAGCLSGFFYVILGIDPTQMSL